MSAVRHGGQVSSLPVLQFVWRARDAVNRGKKPKRQSDGSALQRGNEVLVIQMQFRGRLSFTITRRTSDDMSIHSSLGHRAYASPRERIFAQQVKTDQRTLDTTRVSCGGWRWGWFGDAVTTSGSYMVGIPVIDIFRRRGETSDLARFGEPRCVR